MGRFGESDGCGRSPSQQRVPVPGRGPSGDGGGEDGVSDGCRELNHHLGWLSCCGRTSLAGLIVAAPEDQTSTSL